MGTQLRPGQVLQVPKQWLSKAPVVVLAKSQGHCRLTPCRAPTECISVRQPWRRRLAASLIMSSLRILQEQDTTEAALGVDTEDTSGALRLYERCGFRPCSAARSIIRRSRCRVLRSLHSWRLCGLAESRRRQEHEDDFPALIGPSNHSR